MLRLILVSLFLIATQIIAIEENFTTNGIFGTRPFQSKIGERVVDEDTDSSCTSGNQKGGTCMSVFRCANLFALYKKSARSLRASEKKTLQESFCGWSYGAPYVCCQPSNVKKESSIQKPTVLNATNVSIRCGDVGPRYVNKVIGGGPAELGSLPWMAAMYARTGTYGIPSFRCGGSVIHNEWVLTAAHCIPETTNTVITHVRLGDLDLDESVIDKATPIEVGIKQIIKHEQYSKSPVFNDIALLRLNRSVEFSDFIRPICLHTDKKYLADNFYDPKKPTIAGWGAVEYLGPRSSQLLKANVDVIPRNECLSRYEQFTKTKQIKIDKTVICANAFMVDTCQGDSGGPLMFQDKDKTWHQGGIVSVGFECARLEYPGVYTKVAPFADWIRKKTGLKNL